MSKKKAKSIEQRIVEAIIYDLSDRRGLSGEWDGIDDETKAEIRETWAGIVREEMSKSNKSKTVACGR